MDAYLEAGRNMNAFQQHASARAPVVLVAPDKFKGSLNAVEVAHEIALGISEVAHDLVCVEMPMADGGDGTIEALVRVGWEMVPVMTVDALGRSVQADTAWEGRTVAIELANICGLAMLRGELSPWDAHTEGLGVSIRTHVDSDPGTIAVALGGSASTEGGAGLLVGLGFGVLDENGIQVQPGLRGLMRARRITKPPDFATLREIDWLVLPDVCAPLVGKNGAAHVFGPQKGLGPKEVEVADEALRNWAEVLRAATGLDVADIPGAGAGGGAAAVLLAFFDAELICGSEFISEALDLRNAMQGAVAVVTGEGRVDSTSLMGKAPGVVARIALEQEKPLYIVAGDADSDTVKNVRATSVTLVELAGGFDEAFAHPRKFLRQAGNRIGAMLIEG